MKKASAWFSRWVHWGSYKSLNLKSTKHAKFKIFDLLLGGFETLWLNGRKYAASKNHHKIIGYGIFYNGFVKDV